MAAEDAGSEGSPDRGRGRDKSQMERISLRLPKGQLEAVERAVEQGHYSDRSAAIRDATREKFLEDGENAEDVAEGRGGAWPR